MHLQIFFPRIGNLKIIKLSKLLIIHHRIFSVMCSMYVMKVASTLKLCNLYCHIGKKLSQFQFA